MPLDREAAHAVLRPLLGDDEWGRLDNALDALEGCVRPAPRQTIDRDTLVTVITEADPGDIVEPWLVSRFADRILALLRPVDGVTLTPEEATRVLAWFDAAKDGVDMTDETDWQIIEKLEAAAS